MQCSAVLQLQVAVLLAACPRLHDEPVSSTRAEGRVHRFYDAADMHPNQSKASRGPGLCCTRCCGPRKSRRFALCFRTHTARAWRFAFARSLLLADDDVAPSAFPPLQQLQGRQAAGRRHVRQRLEGDQPPDERGGELVCLSAASRAARACASVAAEGCCVAFARRRGMATRQAQQHSFKTNTCTNTSYNPLSQKRSPSRR